MVMPLLSLTPREWDVLVELCRDGADNRLIAARLFVSPETVKSHMKSILLKSRHRNRTELAVAVLRQEIALASSIPLRAL